MLDRGQKFGEASQVTAILYRSSGLGRGRGTHSKGVGVGVGLQPGRHLNCGLDHFYYLIVVGYVSILSFLDID